MGRPISLQIRLVLMSLDPDKLYSPATIATWAVERGLVEADERQRLRYTLAKVRQRRSFPREGDGLVFLPNNTMPGWFGARWREVLT